MWNIKSRGLTVDEVLCQLADSNSNQRYSPSDDDGQSSSKSDSAAVAEEVKNKKGHNSQLKNGLESFEP